MHLSPSVHMKSKTEVLHTMCKTCRLQVLHIMKVEVNSLPCSLSALCSPPPGTAGHACGGACAHWHGGMPHGVVAAGAGVGLVWENMGKSKDAGCGIWHRLAALLRTACMLCCVQLEPSSHPSLTCTRTRTMRHAVHAAYMHMHCMPHCAALHAATFATYTSAGRHAPPLPRYMHLICHVLSVLLLLSEPSDSHFCAHCPYRPHPTIPPTLRPRCHCCNRRPATCLLRRSSLSALTCQCRCCDSSRARLPT